MAKFTITLKKICILFSNDPYLVKENYITAHAFPEWWENHLNAMVVQETCPLMGKVIGDFGCNHGMITIIIAKNAPESHVVGIDMNKKALKIGEDSAKSQNINNVNFVYSRLENLEEIPEDYFTGGYMIDVLEHIYPKDRSKMFNALRRVLKNGSYFMIDTPYLKAYYDGPSHVDFFDVQKIINIVNENGFILVEVKRDQRIDGHGERHNRLNALIRNKK